MSDRRTQQESERADSAEDKDRQRDFPEKVLPHKTSLYYEEAPVRFIPA